MAEERLHYRGAQRRCQDERARRRERERPLGHEERHQGGYGSLVDVREEVPGGEGRHRPFVYALSLALKLENRCRISAACGMVASVRVGRDDVADPAEKAARGDPKTA